MCERKGSLRAFCRHGVSEFFNFCLIALAKLAVGLFFSAVVSKQLKFTNGSFILKIKRIVTVFRFKLLLYSALTAKV